MDIGLPSDARRRVLALLAALAINGALILALATGLGRDIVRGVQDRLTAISLTVPEPPKPAEPPTPAPPVRSVEPEGAAAPPSLRATPKAVVAPKPLLPLPPVNPVVPAPVAGQGSDARAGAADIDGPGTGAGGAGDGLGAGRGGDGSGGVPIASRARYLKGAFSTRDLPRSVRAVGGTGTVVVGFEVSEAGRVRGCRVEESSGYPELDATTCRLIEQRFRYAPARDRAGRAIADVAGWEQRWWVD